MPPLQWVVNAYLLPLSALILLGGVAGDRYGRKRLLVGGTALRLALASLACALAPSLPLLLAARFAQGATRKLPEVNSRPTQGRINMPADDPYQNHLLAASRRSSASAWPQLQRVAMPLGKVLYESGDVLRHVYFPSDSIVSLLYVMADGASAEIAVVGNEGLIGVPLFMGGETTSNRAMVQSAGHLDRPHLDRLRPARSN